MKRNKCPNYCKRISGCFLLLFFLMLFNGRVVKAQGEPPILNLSTQFERVEILRMGPGADMLVGLNEFVKKEQIKNAVILAGIGSVTDYHFHVVSSKTLPPDEEFPKASVAKDLTSVQGYILNGRVHAHINLSDENSAIGGHLEPGTKALTFFIITIGILPDDLKMENLDNYKI